ncbi:MAG: hypothetical protein ACREIM_02535 [Nitrospiraceae bacterium]
MDLRCPSKHWAIGASATLLALCLGCSEAVMLAHETTEGGIVTYLYKEERGGPMVSPHRKEALDVIQRKCGRTYTIVREGETQGYQTGGFIEGVDTEVKGRRWGLQFKCKNT